MQKSALSNVLIKTAAAVAVVCVAVYAYRKLTEDDDDHHDGAATSQTTTNKLDINKRGTATNKSGEGISKTGDAPKIDLKKASRDDVLELLREIVHVQKELSATMQDVIQRIISENLSVDDTYELVAKNQPEDPLEKNGLSIADFDALLDRFASDEEVHAAIVEVVQGPDQTTAATAPSGGSGNATLTVDRIVEINLTMLAKFRSVIEHFKEMLKSNPNKYNPRTVSITAQAVVGAHVQREFSVSAEDVERAMLVHQLELSMRQDFLQANDDIQKIMGECVHLGGKA